MNGRERLRAALAHREPDRVPVDMGATPSSGISAVAYAKLIEHAGLAGTTDVYDVVQQLAQPSDEFLDRFGIDVVDVGRAFGREDRDWYAITLADGRPARYPAWFRPEAQGDGSFTARHPDGTPIARMPQGSAFYDQSCFPYLDDYPAAYRDLDRAMDKVLWSHLVHSPWKHAGQPGFWDALRRRTLALRASTDRALMIVVGCNLFEWGTFLRRIDNFLMDLLAEPEQVEKLLDALMERHLATLEKVCAAVGDIVDVLRFGDDLGTDGGLFMSPEIYRRLFKPRHAQLCAYVKQHSQMATFLHSCGSIRTIIPDLIEAGYDILNPVHNILPDVPPQNIVAMFDAVRDFNGAR